MRVTLLRACERLKLYIPLCISHAPIIPQIYQTIHSFQNILDYVPPQILQMFAA